MGKKLYIGNLAFAVNDTLLQDTFAQLGTVESAKVILDKMSGRSKGFGFVEMSSEEEAKAAIEKLNGTELMGRAINVSEARPMTPRENRPSSGFGGGRGPGGGDRGGDRRPSRGGNSRGGDRGGRSGGGRY